MNDRIMQNNMTTVPEHLRPTGELAWAPKKHVQSEQKRSRSLEQQTPRQSLQDQAPSPPKEAAAAANNQSPVVDVDCNSSASNIPTNAIVP